MGGYFWEAEDCETLGVLGWNAKKARIEIHETDDGRCDLCGTFAAPNGYRNPVELADWVRYQSADVGNLERVGLERSATRADDDACLCCDSQLAPTIGIPGHLFRLTVSRLTYRQREQVLTHLMIVLCRKCRNSDVKISPDVSGMRDVFCRARNMNARAFESWTGIEVFREVVLLIEDELRRKAG